VALAGTSSHIQAYGREQQVACNVHGLAAQGQLQAYCNFRGIACSLEYRPWSEGEDEQVGIVEAMVESSWLRDTCLCPWFCAS
jgi:hypothetical protein